VALERLRQSVQEGSEPFGPSGTAGDGLKLFCDGPRVGWARAVSREVPGE
jgi:hypothetical protein